MTPEEIDKMKENIAWNNGEFTDAFLITFKFLKRIPGLTKEEIGKLEQTENIVRNIARRDPPGCQPQA